MLWRALAPALLALAFVAFAAGFASRAGLGGPTPARAAPAGRDEPDLAAFWEAWDYVHREFPFRERLDDQKLVYGAARGMVGALAEPYTVFLDPREAEIVNGHEDGSFEGIGLSVVLHDSQVVVRATTPNSPAARAGLRPGDVLLKVDGVPIRGPSLFDSVARVRGPAGTTVELTVRRPYTDTPLTFRIVREVIPEETVAASRLANGISYVKLASFNGRAAPELRRALDEVLDADSAGLILDLRGNPGGLLRAALAVASEFLDTCTVLTEIDSEGHRASLRARPGGRATTLPLVVLVDGGSASAAEVVAGALRDCGRARLIGAQTYGKGTVQTVQALSDGSSLRLTVARWLTPNGRSVNGVGLTPDILADSPDPVRGGLDAAFEEAIQQLLRSPRPSR